MRRLILLVLTLLLGLLAGIIVGCLAGAAEILLFLPNTTGTSHALLIPAMIFYSLFWSASALALGLPIFLVSQVFGKPLESAESLNRWYYALLIPSFIFLVAGGHFNLRFLPESTDPRSLLLNGRSLPRRPGLIRRQRSV